MERATGAAGGAASGAEGDDDHALFLLLAAGEEAGPVRAAAELRWQALSAQPRTADTERSLALCASAALTDYFVRWSDFRGLRQWLTRCAALAWPDARSGLGGLHLLGGRLCALRLDEQAAAAEAPILTLLDEALVLLDVADDAQALDLALLHAPVILECCQVVRRNSIAQDLERRCTRHPGWSRVAPLWQGRLYDSLAAAYYVLDQQADAARCEALALGLAELHGLQALRFELLKLPLRGALEAGRHDEADVLLEQMAACMDARNLGQAVEYWDLRGRWLLAREQLSAAADAMARAVETATLGEMPLQRRAVLWSMASAIHLAMGQGGPALEALQQAREVSHGVQARVLDTGLLVAQAWLALQGHHADATQRLCAAFAALSSLNLVRFLRPLPRLAAQLCNHALEAGADREFVVRVIAERSLPRPADAGAAWPSPVRVACLGPGEVTLADGSALVRGKTPVRSLELLWWIGAHDGQPVPVQGCLKALWPDGEPEAARAAFDMALARLRRLLGPQAELRLDAGRLVPDERAFWFDTALQRELVSRITRPGTSPAEALALAARLIASYGGPFVGQAADLPWVLAARERQMARCSRGVRAAADLQRIDGNDAAVESLLHAAIEAAPMDEALAQRLIALYAARGDTAQAMRAYSHLRYAREAAELPAPSAQTRALLAS